MNGFFVTGTDTEIGKTEVSSALLIGLAGNGFQTVGMKPIASGCVTTKEGLRNSDAMQLQRSATREVPYCLINPYAFEPPIAPHLAAEIAGVAIEREHILDAFNQISEGDHYTVVEGVGGWLVPLNPHYTVENLAQDLLLPVIIVVGLRLGCLNHALLTERAILSSGCKVAGWVGNHMSPEFTMSNENIQTLEREMESPNLGVFPFLESVNPEALAQYLNLDRLASFTK